MSDLRPRSYNSKKLATLARHGRLPKSTTVKAVSKFVAASLAVVLVSGACIAGVATWDVLAGVKPGVALGGPGESETPSIGPIEGAVNLAIIGSDSREGQGDGFGDPSVETSVLNDVTMLLHLSEDHKQATVVSFPRDMYVPIPSCPDPDDPEEPFSAMSSQKINTTLSYGGMACTVLTLEALTGLDINYAASVQFMGVVDMSKAVGGVPVCVANRIDDYRTDTYLEPGMHTLEGMAALQFLRTRYGVGDGSDLSRISNQQLFLSSLVRTVKSADTLANPVKVYSLAKAVVDNMQLSESLTDINTLISIAVALKDIDLNNVVFVQYPTGSVEGGVAPIPDLAEEMNLALQNDTPIGLSGQLGLGAVTKDGSSTAAPKVPGAKSGDSAGAGDESAGSGDSGESSDSNDSSDGSTDASSPTPKPTKLVLPENVTGQTAAEETCAAGNG